MTLASTAFHFDLGDVPTWLAVVAATAAAFVALRALKAQNRETERQVAALERQQADQVDVRSTPVVATADRAAGQPGKRPLFNRGITVENGSRRPIRDIAARLDSAGDGQALIEPARTGFVRDGGTTWGDSSVMDLLRARNEGSFYFAVPTNEHPKATILIRFTDDAGLHWQIDHNLHLQKLPGRDW